MSTTRLLDLNPLTGEAVLFADHNDGTFELVHVQSNESVQSILDVNKRRANMTARSRRQRKENWWHYATIPNVILLRWNKEINGNILAKENAAELFKRLNMREHEYLRATHGRHTVKG